VRRLLKLALIAGGLAVGYAIYALNRPYAGFTGETFVDIPRGTNARGIAALLLKHGVIESEWHFLAARAVFRGRTLQAGEYRFSEPASTLGVFDRLARGDIFYKELVVPEGKNMFEVAELAAALGYFSAAEFLQAAKNPAPIRDLAPAATSLEGYLFPSTYRVNRQTTPQQLVSAMTAEFRRVWKSLEAKAPVHETVILASLVEKEGKVEEERPLIAAVYRNRLKLGMRLDADPTTIYAAILQGRYQGSIRRSDLESTHPYNTYRNPGLPPGPIANPGRASLAAALDPADAKYLYFVAKPDGSGRHIFSETYEAHGAAVAEYRRGAN
jgi:UPF0755 protein